MLRRPMYRKMLMATALVGLLLGAATVAFAAHNSADPGEPKAFSMLGLANVQGETVIVDVVVAVQPGEDARAVALAALAEQGARPFDSAEFSTTGLVWDQFSDADTTNDFVTQNYNPGNDPTGNGETALTNTHATWTDVSTSTFAFQDGGTTTRCPSLVRECPGKQEFDGNNDVAWLQLRGCCTLGVTWFSTSIDEADVALNTNFNWATDGSDFDVVTVFLHENGHVVGLGHSAVTGAVMEPSYAGVRRALHQDDKDGISALYPADGTSPEPTPTPTATATPSGDEPTATLTPTPMPTATPSSGTVSASSITYATTGGGNGDKHLFITVALVDDLGNPVSDASVSIDVFRDDSFYGSGTGTTGTGGTVTFKATNAPSGTYNTTVTAVTAEGLTWDSETPVNSFTK